MNPAPHPTEWDFSSVPDSEIRDACFYEYVREAEFFRWRQLRDLMAEREKRMGSQPSFDGQIVEGAPLLQGLFLNGRMEEHEDPFVMPPAWPQLSAEQKVSVRLLLAVLRRDVPHLAGERSLTPEMTPVRIDYVAPPRTSRGQSLWIQPGDTFLMDRQGSRPGRVLFAREVNLSGFTDTQIVAEFEHWLKETRRAFGIAAPVARGKSITKDAEILADLSWMRLVAQYAKDEIPPVVTRSRYAALSAIFKPRRGQVFSAEEVYRTIRDKRRHDARNHFGKIFERNGVHCDPASWKTWYERQSAPPLR